MKELGNQYRYYRCTTKNNKHKDLCQSRMVRLDKLDAVILDVMCRNFVTPERVAAMLRELQRKSGNQNDADIMKEVSLKLEAVKLRMQRIYNAIEEGLVPLDADLKERTLTLTKEKEVVAAQMQVLQNRQQLQTDTIDPEAITEFCTLLRERLFDQQTPLAKQYLKKLVKEVVFKNDEVKIIGGYAELAGVIRVADKKNDLSTHAGVLRSSSSWLPNPDSNHGQGG
ncbi:zinc ribbon domain-containing protein [Geobacter sp. FeAm09]|uniref:zinc ribbon domain-containing protein n=1 Tax=Geobacter sp. FeAm09 TaxID=2597769 RepID=UPI00197A81BE|nr:zinc ribbon domain-containing protein [Geobacter sp. FeAm09]